MKPKTVASETSALNAIGWVETRHPRAIAPFVLHEHAPFRGLLKLYYKSYDIYKKMCVTESETILPTLFRRVNCARPRGTGKYQKCNVSIGKFRLLFFSSFFWLNFSVTLLEVKLIKYPNMMLPGKGHQLLEQ